MKTSVKYIPTMTVLGVRMFIFSHRVPLFMTTDCHTRSFITDKYPTIRKMLYYKSNVYFFLFNEFINGNNCICISFYRKSTMLVFSFTDRNSILPPFDSQTTH